MPEQSERVVDSSSSPFSVVVRVVVCSAVTDGARGLAPGGLDTRTRCRASGPFHGRTFAASISMRRHDSRGTGPRSLVGVTPRSSPSARGGLFNR